MRDLRESYRSGMIMSRSDFGDCVHNMGTVHFQKVMAVKLNLMSYSKFPYVGYISWMDLVERLEVKPGYWVRHDAKGDWTNNPETMSRDAMRPILRAAKAGSDMGVIKRFAWAHLKRLWLFMPNVRRNGSRPSNHGMYYIVSVPMNRWYKFIIKYKIPLLPTPKGIRNYNWKPGDPTGLVFWAFLFRCLDWKIMYPTFWVADMVSVVKSYGYIAKMKREDTTFFDCRNHIEHLQFSRLFYSTWFNDWAIRIMDEGDVQRMCDGWWSQERNEAPINTIMIPLNKYIFKHRR